MQPCTGQSLHIRIYFYIFATRCDKTLNQIAGGSIKLVPTIIAVIALDLKLLFCELTQQQKERRKKLIFSA
jgi:hypothetical protein